MVNRTVVETFTLGKRGGMRQRGWAKKEEQGTHEVCRRKDDSASNKQPENHTVTEECRRHEQRNVCVCVYMCARVRACVWQGRVLPVTTCEPLAQPALDGPRASPPSIPPLLHTESRSLWSPAAACDSARDD